MIEHRTESVSGGFRAVLLKCPKCREDLTGIAIDRVFFCRRCRIGVDFWEDPPGIIPVIYARCSEPADDKVLRLPVWRYRADIRIETMTGNEEAARNARGAIPETVYVFGSVFQRLTLFGDPNVELTAAAPVLDMAGDPGEVIGCQLRREHADRLLEPVAVSVIDKVQDVTDLDIRIVIRRRDLIALPFTVTGKLLKNPASGIQINRMSFLMEPMLPIKACNPG
ncbi:MAG TPA: hypothetical protein PLV45_00390 [bacterium]|nr:hypothetical protein [bacterium]